MKKQKKYSMKTTYKSYLINLIIIFLMVNKSVFAQIDQSDVVLQIGHSSKVNQVVFTPDERYFLTCSNDHSVKVWNTLSGKNFTIYDNEREINGLAIAPNGKTGAYFTDKSIKIFDIQTKEMKGEYKSGIESLYAVDFLKDDLLLIRSMKHFIIWDTKSQTEKDKVPCSYTFRDKIFFTLNAERTAMAIVEENYKVVVYKLPGIIKTARFSIDPDKVNYISTLGHTITDIKFSPDGKTIACATNSGQIGLYDLEKRKLFILRDAKEAFSMLTFSNDGNRLFVANENKIHKIDVETGKLISQNNRHKSSISAMIFSPKSNYLTTAYAGDVRGDNDYSVKLWSGNTNQLIKSYDLTGYRTLDLSFIQKTNKLVLYRDDESLLEFDLSLLKLKEITNPFQVKTGQVYICPTSGQILISNFEGEIVKLNPDKNYQSEKFSAFKDHYYIYQMAFMPSSNTIVVASMFDSNQESYKLSVFDTKKEAVVSSKVIPKLTYLAVSTEKNIAIGFKDKIEIFDQQLNQILQIPLSNRTPSMLQFSANGKNLTVGYEDGEFMTETYNVKLGIRKHSIDAKGLRDLRGTSSGKRSIAIPVFNGRELISGGNYKDFSIRKYATLTGDLISTFKGHKSEIVSISISNDSKYMISSSFDGTIKIWDYSSGKELATLATFNKDGFVIYTPEKYYRASKDAASAIAFNRNGSLLPFEQLDLVYNRPDIVLNKINAADSLTQLAYYNAYKKRVEKMGFKSLDPDKSLDIPQLNLIGLESMEMSTPESKLTLKVKANDAKHPLKRINIWVNGVPVYGIKGYPVENNSKTFEKDFTIELSQGLNKIGVSAHNSQGFESLKTTFEVSSTQAKRESKVYLIAIGVSEYINSEYNLTYAAKDALDLATVFKENYNNKNVVTHIINDQKATSENILALKQILNQTAVNDEVIVFIAGHGLLDRDLNYYIATHNVDFENPQHNGLPYTEIENLLDGIPSRKKMLLIDACHSGEVDKSSGLLANNSAANIEGVSTRGFKTNKSPQTSMGTYESFELMKELFADLRQGTGAVVISSAGGAEFAFESSEWKNGVFTYALLEGLKTGNADADKNGEIVVSELRNYVFERVKKLTNGQQNPTSRRENLEFDFRVW